MTNCDDWDTNHIVIIAQDGSRRLVGDVPGCDITMRGKNNRIELYQPIGDLHLNVDIGSNCNITIYPIMWSAYLRIMKLEQNTAKTRLSIGRNFSTTDWVRLEFAPGGPADITIGDDCMFAWDIEISTGDYHSIINNNGRTVNYNSSVIIGNHVWVARHVFISKGAHIPDNCIVGAHSVIAKKFKKRGCVIVGNPARIVRRNVNWNRDIPLE